MKNILLLAAAILTFNVAYAQKDIPQAAVATVKQKFPNIEIRV